MAKPFTAHGRDDVNDCVKRLYSLIGIQEADPDKVVAAQIADIISKSFPEPSAIKALQAERDSAVRLLNRYQAIDVAGEGTRRKQEGLALNRVKAQLDQLQDNIASLIAKYNGEEAAPEQGGRGPTDKKPVEATLGTAAPVAQPTQTKRPRTACPPCGRLARARRGSLWFRSLGVTLGLLAGGACSVVNFRWIEAGFDAAMGGPM